MKATPTSPEVVTGRWGVYFELNINSQYGLQRSNAVLEGYTVNIYGEPVPGALDIGLTGHTSGSQIDILNFTMPLSQQSNQYEQEAFFAPLVTNYSGGTGFVISFTSHTPVPPVNPVPTFVPAKQTLRCDNAQEVNGGTGCVKPKYAPNVVYSSTVYPYIASNISQDQRSTGRGLLNSPLHRVTGAQLDANRNAACSTARKNALPSPNPNVVNPECDEYPFASAAEGGATSTIKWVPKAENSAQGDLMSSFYRLNRIMVGDAFTVSTS